MSRFWSYLALPAVLVAAAFVAACGGASRSQDPQPPRAAQLLSVWRNFEETGIPEDMTIYADGEVEYRNLLHTQFGIRVIDDRLAPARLTRIRRALDAVDLTEVDASNLKPRRSGFRYVIRSGGHVGTAVDGHLPAQIRPLVTELRAQMDRLQEKSLG